MSRDSYHVVSRADGKWSVRKTGEGRASKVFGDRSAAISYARTIARGNNGEMIVHGRDGRIRESNSYGKDSASPRNSR